MESEKKFWPETAGNKSVMSTKTAVLTGGGFRFPAGGSFFKKSGKALEILGFSAVEKAVENVNNSL